jgi:8-oxo-dGTP pyrophosphatase MutT (NUDIX family)
MEILGKKRVYEGRFTSYWETDFINRVGKEGRWEYLKRNNNTQAVLINVINSDNIVLVKQFRFAAGKYILEFPAGLIDPGESVGLAAERELLEETGYQGKCVKISPPLCTSPGITDEIIYIADLEISGDRGEQSLDDSEEIEVVEFNRERFSKEIINYIKENPDTIIDSKVWSAYYMK